MLHNRAQEYLHRVSVYLKQYNWRCPLCNDRKQIQEINHVLVLNRFREMKMEVTIRNVERKIVMNPIVWLK